MAFRLNINIAIIVSTALLQYLHPFQAAKYRSVVRQIRAIGRNCIKERIQVIENNEQTPNDILSHILQMACKSFNINVTLQ